MTVDHIRYDLLTQEALRDVVRTVLTDTAKNGVPGEHHFFIAFDTRVPGVRLSASQRAQYPEEMTIILQHQFWDLAVNDEAFEVGLSFGGVAERLRVPFVAIKSFYDPSVRFGLQFETATSADPAKTKDGGGGKPEQHTVVQPQPPSAAEVTALPANSAPALKIVDNDDDKPVGGGEVVRLDRFRKK